MSEVKKSTTYKEQMELLKSRGCEIADEEFCIECLKAIGYYRLSAYFIPFKCPDGSYCDGTKFENIIKIYEFDRKLRNILFGALETIEIYFRSNLSYLHGNKYGSLGYMNSFNFNKHHNHDKFTDNINREVEKNSSSPFVAHHIENYESQFPVWVVFELFTFGMLSRFYNDMLLCDQKDLARSLSLYYRDISSWLRCCTDLRNICAHYGRLYNRTFSAIPSNLNLESCEERTLWGAVLSVKMLFPSTERWNIEIVGALCALFEKYSDAVLLECIGFPEDWQNKILK